MNLQSGHEKKKWKEKKRHTSTHTHLNALPPQTSPSMLFGNAV